MSPERVPTKKLHSYKWGNELYFLVVSTKGLNMMDWISNYVKNVVASGDCDYFSFSPFELYSMLLVLMIYYSLGLSDLLPYT